MKTGRLQLTTDYIQQSTGFHHVATGTLSNRPTAPINGMLRFNTTTYRYEAYINGAWVNLISDLDLTPTNFVVPTGENITRAIVSAMVQDLNQSFTGTVTMSGWYGADSGYGNTLPAWITSISGPSVYGLAPSQGVNFMTCDTNSMSMIIDVAVLAGVQKQRFNYIYNTFSVVSGNLHYATNYSEWINTTEMVQMWSNNTTDPNYGCFKLTVYCSYGYMIARWYANIYKYQNFSQF